MSSLRVERAGEWLRITLARPERRNAFDPALVAELTEAFGAVGEARAVVLTGEGPSFCAGADIEAMRAAAQLSQAENIEDALRLRRLLEAVDGCPAPVVALVHGHALGGGLGLICCADIAVAHPDTVFGFSETKLGIIPAVISPFALAAIGPRAARRYFVTGERFDAETALRLALVHALDDDLENAGEDVLAQLASAGPEAARAAKRLVLDAPLDARETAGRIAHRRASAEAQEGLSAFLKKRRASWRAD
jgi:methylglutaconyl-CoA hydratase